MASNQCLHDQRIMLTAHAILGDRLRQGRRMFWPISTLPVKTLTPPASSMCSMRPRHSASLGHRRALTHHRCTAFLRERLSERHDQRETAAKTLMNSRDRSKTVTGPLPSS